MRTPRSNATQPAPCIRGGPVFPAVFIGSAEVTPSTAAATRSSVERDDGPPPDRPPNPADRVHQRGTARDPTAILDRPVNDPRRLGHPTVPSSQTGGGLV